MVTIKGERQNEETVENGNYYYQECYWGGFSRSVPPARRCHSGKGRRFSQERYSHHSPPQSRHYQNEKDPGPRLLVTGDDQPDSSRSADSPSGRVGISILGHAPKHSSSQLSHSHALPWLRLYALPAQAAAVPDLQITAGSYRETLSGNTLSAWLRFDTARRFERCLHHRDRRSEFLRGKLPLLRFFPSLRRPLPLQKRARSLG